MGTRTRRTPLLLIVLLVAALVPATVAGTAHAAQPTARAECMKGGWQDFTNAGFRNQGDCIRFVQTGTFTCRDPLGCVSYAADEPVRLATALVTSGPVSFLGIDELRGVELALVDHGLVFGRAVELVNEDSMCSPEGGTAAATAIVADPKIVGVVGTTCSGAALAAAPIISDAGYSMVSPSNTAPVLTDPSTRSDGYFRVAWDDADQADVMAAFVVGEGAATSIVVNDGDPYSVSLGEAFVEAFEGLGGDNPATFSAASDGSDVVAIVDAISALDEPDVLYMPVFAPLGPLLVLELRSRSPLFDDTQLAAGDALAVPGIAEALGADGEGMVFTVPDPVFLDTPEYAAFAAAYLAAYAAEPLTLFAPYGYDAAGVVLAAIEAAGIADGAGTLHVGRQALRDALHATAGYDGVTGTISCGPFGQCGSIGFLILRIVDEELVPVP